MSESSIRRHGIDRREWVARFTQAIGNALELTGPKLEHIAAAELESWPAEDASWIGWQTIQPEEAARENLADWSE